MYLHCEYCKKLIHKNHIQRHIQTKQHMVASGIWDSIKGVFNNIADRFKGKRLDGFNKESTKVLNDFGSEIITRFQVAKKPIHSMLDKFINVLSLNKWNELKDKFGFDKMMHLCLIAHLANGKSIYVEKIDSVTISTVNKIAGKDTQYLDVSAPQNLSLSQFIEGSRKFVGNDKLYYDYDPWKNNCQVFVGDYLLKSIGKYGEREKNFIFQDVSQIAKEMPSIAKTVMQGVTDLGQIANRFLGKGKFVIHAVKIKKHMAKDEALKHAKNIANTKKNLLYKEMANYHSYRVVPKTHFKPKTFRYKTINPDIKIVLGQLL